MRSTRSVNPLLETAIMRAFARTGGRPMMIYTLARELGLSTQAKQVTQVLRNAIARMVRRRQLYRSRDGSIFVYSRAVVVADLMREREILRWEVKAYQDILARFQTRLEKNEKALADLGIEALPLA